MHFEQIFDLRKAFNKIDKNNDGYISKEELKQLIEQNNMSMAQEEDLNNIYDQCDKNRSGKIDFEDFIKMVLNDV